ncbi:winged helix-turn-helix transcriptional regulator [Streptomyces sp. NA04227]|uniref:ArsR/SmtB family transcription factor n=1 Tax=Streptomyces sp. NA04227 TaxID=2742136 RepID=UPI001590B15D|nr:winged helix-turn-helix domain-containing protein [Streptomyces sp. NA04227]QKW08881.1 winged helix-turn-helix transcriptional regulator [Streptomyces sp. NA04227]
MIRIHLTPDALVTTRFVVSPLKHLRLILDSRFPAVPVDGYPASGDVVTAIRELKLRRLGLLRGFVDDFPWLPSVPSAFRPELSDELQMLTKAHADLVPRLTSYLNRSGQIAGAEQAARATELRGLLEARGREFTDALFDEAYQLFQRVLAPHWSAMASRVESEIDFRGRVAARGGVGAMLSRLHPAIDAHGDVILIRDRRDVATRVRGQVTFYPTAIGPVHMVDLGRAETASPVAISYPVGRREETGTVAEGGLDDVLGQSRVRLLTSLSEPRTTSQLAGLHQLSPSTVSYHLSRLHGAGLVTRTRMGSNVYYQCSPKADIFAQRATVSRYGTPRRVPRQGGGGGGAQDNNTDRTSGKA